MNTKILLALAGAVALSACAKNTASKAEIVDDPAARPATAGSSTPASRPGPVRPSRPTGDPVFRTPDATKKLYEEGATYNVSSRQPGTTRGGSPHSVSPPPSDLPVIPADLPVEAPIGQTE